MHHDSSHHLTLTSDTTERRVAGGPLVAAVGVAVTLMGLLGPWAKVLGLVSTNVSGLDTPDGKLLGVLLLAAALTLIGAWLNQKRSGWMLWGLLCLLGVGIAALGFYELNDVGDRLNDANSQYMNVSVGWGLYAVIAGGITTAVGAFVALGHTRYDT